MTAPPMTIERAKQLLQLCADGRREYASGGPSAFADQLEIEARAFEHAVLILDGDTAILRSLLPSWRWDAILPDPTDNGHPSESDKATGGPA